MPCPPSGLPLAGCLRLRLLPFAPPPPVVEKRDADGDCASWGAKGAPDRNGVETATEEEIYGASSLLFETLQQAWEWATEQRVLPPRSGVVADCTNRAVVWSPRTDVEARDWRQSSKRRRTRRGGGGTASARPAPGPDLIQADARNFSLSDTLAIFDSLECPP
ncbi:hypothetical protein NDU88_002475 [Pleurodeles waltl]|uniref:Uncharacterized protein n=1 Tax=Pleurodeles waltl TaxID=8319 RepID=A0AAV7RBZ7_PLEWA|nr:hypothetical protein NDU88_002475 [Pleurodeles waltl]